MSQREEQRAREQGLVSEVKPRILRTIIPRIGMRFVYHFVRDVFDISLSFIY